MLPNYARRRTAKSHNAVVVAHPIRTRARYCSVEELDIEEVRLTKFT
jgi:hypothetical protein